MMLRALLLSVTLMLPPAAQPAATSAASCTGYTSRTTPPKTIRVFRLHRKGSSAPARVETWDFKNYVGSVMESGAWPSKPSESAKVGAIVIKQYAWWMKLHHQPGHWFRGKCYDITDSEQFIRGYFRPGHRLNRRTSDAVAHTWGVTLRKNGRFFRTGWSGEGTYCGSRYDGWHVYEGGVTTCARNGWGYRRILGRYLNPGMTIVR